MADKKLRVFLSSTSIDLGEIREQLAACLFRYDFEPVFMGQYTAAAVPPLEKVLRDVASCDIYVGLFAFWYGEPIPDLGKSHTELEYQEAKQRGIPCLLFLLDGDVNYWKPSWIDKGERGVLMEKLRTELMQQNKHKHTVCLFKDPAELLTKVPPACLELKKQGIQRAQTPETSLSEPKGESVVGLRFQDVRCFKDRTEELAQIQRALADANVKVISIFGRSGAGKTALVSRFGELVETGGFRFPRSGAAVDGIVYFPCRRSSGIVAERLWYDICELLPPSRREELRKIWTDTTYSEEEKFRQLLVRFQQGHYLVFLDGFESVVVGAGISDSGLRTFLEICLRTPHSIRVVITADVNFELPSDSRHYYRQLNLDRGLPPAEAMELLRSLDTDGNLELASASDELLLRVVQRCEGLPRMLIAIVGILSNDETLSVERLLDDEVVWPDIIKEQYERLSEDLQHVLQVLAAFDCPVSREAVEYVVLGLARGCSEDPFAADDDGRTLPKLKQCLSDLVHGQIVSANRRQGTYEIQAKMQEYAYAHIPEQKQGYGRRRCHELAADYYATRRKPQNEWKCIDDIQPQLDEFDHRIRGGQFELAATVLETVDEEFLQLWGRFQLLIQMHERLVNRLEDPDRAHKALGSLAISYRRMGRHDDSIACFQKAIENAVGDAKGLSNWHTELGNTYADAINMTAAVAEYHHAIEIAGSNGDLAGEARALGNLAIAYRQLGQMEQAIQHYEEAIQRDRQRMQAARTSDEVRAARRWYANHIGNKGKALLALGHIVEAKKCLDEAFAIFIDLQYVYGAATFQHHIAEAALLEQDAATAIRLCENSVAQLANTGETRNFSYILYTLSLAHSSRAEFDVALDSCEKGLVLHVPETRHAFLLLRGILRLAQGNNTLGQADFVAAIAACNKVVTEATHFYEALYTRGVAELAAGEHKQAMETFRRALAVCSASGVRHATLLVLELLSRVAPQTAGLPDARELLKHDLPALA